MTNKSSLAQKQAARPWQKQIIPKLACPGTPTYDRAKQTQTGGVALPRVSRALPPGRGQGYTQANGAMELASPRLHGDHRAKVCLVTQQLGNQFVRNWLSLKLGVNDGGGGDAIWTEGWWCGRKRGCELRGDLWRYVKRLKWCWDDRIEE